MIVLHDLSQLELLLAMVIVVFLYESLTHRVNRQQHKMCDSMNHHLKYDSQVVIHVKYMDATIKLQSHK